MDRLQHITSVAYLTFRVCRHFGLDYRKAARAATMHDLFYYDWHENDWSHRPHGYRHPKFAAANAKLLCGGLDRKVNDDNPAHVASDAAAADKPRGNGSFAHGQILRIERDENSQAERERLISGASMNRSTKEREAL